MKNNKYYLIYITGTVILMILIFCSSIIYINNKESAFKENYIAVFKGQSNNEIYSTYVYEKKKSNKKIQYKYINTKVQTNQFDNINYNETVLKKGTVKSKKKVFEIAKKNNANSYVLSSKNTKVYSITEFENYWLKKEK